MSVHRGRGTDAIKPLVAGLLFQAAMLVCARIESQIEYKAAQWGIAPKQLGLCMTAVAASSAARRPGLACT